MAIAISAEGLGKKYRLSHGGSAPYLALREELGRLFRRESQPRSEEFWALRDVGFSIQEGERVGVIGRNGAGKSTLLKILSRITEPTTGSARIRGRASSLLEVGTGFHPELSGRENVFLNGAILGMPRREIARKFDAIVAFAQVEKFLDTPVKHYSSGMYVRLAFSVAAHLEPDILIVDEVLAVGDAHFQKRCLGKLQEAESRGRTILFVSHNMPMVTSLCERCILLDQGAIAADGPTSSVVLEYYASGGTAAGKPVGDEMALLVDAGVTNAAGEVKPEVLISEPCRVFMRYRLLGDVRGRPVPNFHFAAADGTPAFVSQPQEVTATRQGEYRAECRIPAHFLNEGMYSVSLALTTYFDDAPIRSNFYQRDALSFNVRDPMDESTARYGWTGPIPGVVRPRLDWVVSEVA